MATKIDLKKFRHDIATLKKRGLISGVDARSATPTRKLKAAIERYDAVLSGKASAVRLNRKGLAEYKALGKPYEIAKPKGLPPRVIVPHDANERVTVTHGKVRVSNPAGIHRTILPTRFEDLEDYLMQLKRKKVPLGKDEFLAFRFFGNRSHKFFRSIDALVDYLSHYVTVFDAIDEDNAEAQQEIYQNLEIVKIDRPGEWEAGRPKRHESYKNDRSKYRRRKKQLEHGPEWKLAEYKKKQAERQRAFRARLKGSAKAKYKAQAKKRAKKSARKKK